jgi:hypothetical protein
MQKLAEFQDMRERLPPSRSPRDADVMAYIEAMDFTLLIEKLSRVELNTGIVWPRLAAEKAVCQYKRYLYLLYKYGRQAQPFPPSLEIEEIWHHHILHTEQYHRDCQYIFGGYLHHFPYSGMRDLEDFQNLQSSFAETRALYEAEFGERLCKLIDFEPRNS